jgi:Replication-relaxation
MSRRYLTAVALQELDSQLLERDRMMLGSVSELRFLSGDQLTRWHFGSDQASARAARRALLRLTELGVLARLPRAIGGVRRGSAGFVYRLARAGQGLVADYGWQPRRRYLAHVPGTLFLRHALQVAELHTLLVEAERAGRIELLERTAEPVCWRRTLTATLKPDSYVRVGDGDYEDCYFIEVDMGSEGSRTIDGKLRTYLAYYQSGREQAERGVFPRVLWTTPDSQRGSVIEDCIARLQPRERELFAVELFTDVLSVISNSVGVTNRQPDIPHPGVQ